MSKITKESTLSFLLRLLNLFSFHSIPRLLLQNLLFPSRTLARLRNNKSKRLKLNFFSAKFTSYVHTNVIFDHSDYNESFLKAEQALRYNGAVVIENYFNPDSLDDFVNTYSAEIDDLQASESKFSNNLVYSAPLLNLWMDEKIVQFIEHYFGPPRHSGG